MSGAPPVDDIFGVGHPPPPDPATLPVLPSDPELEEPGPGGLDDLDDVAEADDDGDPTLPTERRTDAIDEGPGDPVTDVEAGEDDQAGR